MTESIISLIGSTLVALGALCGVFVNNKKADERRKKDQQAENGRRKDEDERRDQERREQLRREDWARQRKAVAECVAVFRDEFPELGNLYVSIENDTEVADSAFLRYMAKGKQLLAFYRKIVRSLNVATIEVSNPRVKRALDQLMKATRKDYAELIDAERNSEGEVGIVAMETNAIGPTMEKALSNLIEVANQQFQDHAT